MKVLYGSQIFNLQRWGGISRYIYTLCKYSDKEFDYKVSGVYSDNIYAEKISNLKHFPIKSSFKGKLRIINYCNYFNDRMELKKSNFDIYHPTYYNINHLDCKKPIVITAHDFIDELFREIRPGNDYIINAKIHALEKADKIIAISNNTKNDILKIYPHINPSKIEVVYHAIEWTLGEKHKMNISLDKPYILFTGQRDNYKNFQFFLESIASILLENNIYLVCTGAKFSEYETQMIESLNLNNNVVHVFANEDELKALYENSICFVYPSLYEGFGLPILEAFASETPAILANASCFPEIAQDAALYFDPRSMDDIKNQINKILQSESLRKDLISKGSIRFKDFSINNMIHNTAMVYKSLL